MAQPNHSKETKSAVSGAPGALSVCPVSLIPTSSPDACQAIQTQTEPRAGLAIHSGGATNQTNRRSPMLVEPLRTSTVAPVINFGTTIPHTRRPAAISAVQKLCAEYERALAAFNAALRLYGDAENAALDARPKPHPLIRPTKRNLADVPDYSWGADRRLPSQRCPITSGEIKREIKSLRGNTVKVEGSGKNKTVTHCAKGFPLTREQKARLARVEARLPIAQAYEAELAALRKRFKVDELDAASQVPSRKLRPLALRIAEMPSKDRHDMLAKVRIRELDGDMAEVSEEIGMSICHDFIRLSALGAV
jgi:hypothetical protein